MELCNLNDCSKYGLENSALRMFWVFPILFNLIPKPPSFPKWYPGRDSNPHLFLDQILKLVLVFDIQ